VVWREIDDMPFRDMVPTNARRATMEAQRETLANYFLTPEKYHDNIIMYKEGKIVIKFKYKYNAQSRLLSRQNENNPD